MQDLKSDDLPRINELELEDEGEYDMVDQKVSASLRIELCLNLTSLRLLPWIPQHSCTERVTWP